MANGASSGVVFAGWSLKESVTRKICQVCNTEYRPEGITAVEEGPKVPELEQDGLGG